MIYRFIMAWAILFSIEFLKSWPHYLQSIHNSMRQTENNNEEYDIYECIYKYI